jgi:hypothetical protein
MRFPPLSSAFALLAITVSGAFIPADAAQASSRSGFAASAPEGFEALSAEREVVLDAYFAGRKLGEVRARLSPGLIRFNEPEALAALVPDVADRSAVVALLSGPLATNAAKACGRSPREGCGMLADGQYGVIVDEERFRVDLLLSPNLLVRPDPAAERFLPAPPGEPSLISLFGLTASGSSRGGETLHFQNRAIASVGSLRLRSDSSISTDTGLTFDDLTLESDRSNWRYIAGLFWAPGSDLIGRRKIAGAGIATQLDTRQNKEVLLGTPVSIFLQQPAKVDLLVDGRIVASRIYPAGNRLVDTASLPNGSYELVVRIQEDGRPPREEQRFFSKGSAMAPAGRPLFSVFAGVIPSSGRGLSLKGDDYFYEATAAYRLSPALGIDAALLGTQHKAIVEGGATYHLPWAQLRVAALLSNGADYGGVVRFNSVGQGPWSFSFDLRKVVSRDGDPLLPVTRSRGTFSEDPDSGFADRGSFTQALSIIGYRLAQANVRLTALYRRNGSQDANYSIGGAIDVPVLRTGRIDIVLQADARRSERDFASFIGARFLMNRGRVALSGSGGLRYQSNRPGSDAQPVGEGQASWYRQLADHGQVAGELAAGRDVDGSYARASFYARLPMINARADLLQQFGDHRTTQYAATLDGGIALTRSGIAIAGRDINDSGILVSANGGEAGQEFDILIDEVTRGTVGNGEQSLLYLQPYKSYDVRLRPRGAQIASFDRASRSVTLYPGTVARVEWSVTPLFILFGRAIAADGRPIANADVIGAHGIGRTDASGYFQIETNSSDQLRLAKEAGSGCVLKVAPAKPAGGLVPAGDVKCE